MRPTTIAKRAAEISRLGLAAQAVEAESEREFGFVTEKHQRQADKLRARETKLRDETIERLSSAGLCGPEGLSPDEADRLCDRYPVVAACDCLWELGDGWC